jgi:hypothetical protein
VDASRWAFHIEADAHWLLEEDSGGGVVSMRHRDGAEGRQSPREEEDRPGGERRRKE